MNIYVQIEMPQNPSSSSSSSSSSSHNMTSGSLDNLALPLMLDVKNNTVHGDFPNFASTVWSMLTYADAGAFSVSA